MKGKAPKSKYRPQWGVIVLCGDEAEQIKVFNRLKKEGYKLRVVVT